MPIAFRNGCLCLVTAALLAGCLWHRPDGHKGTLASMARMEATPLPGTGTGLRAQWFGVSTLLIGDGETSILIDGFFSRPGRMKTLFSRIEPDEGVIREALKKGGVGKVDAVLVSHSHYDHAMDAPFVAKEKNALLVGSESTLHIARAEGMTSGQLRSVNHGDRVRIGRFEVEVYRTPHAPTVFRGANDEGFEGPVRFYGYKKGANHSFLLRHPEGRVLVVPSAGSRPEMLKGAQAEVVFLAIGALGKQERGEIEAYWEQAVVRTGARLVIPTHWDDFTRPFSEPLHPFPWPFDKVDAALGTLADLACARRVQLKLMPLNKPVPLTRAVWEAQAACAGTPAP